MLASGDVVPWSSWGVPDAVVDSDLSVSELTVTADGVIVGKNGKSAI